MLCPFKIILHITGTISSVSTTQMISLHTNGAIVGEGKQMAIEAAIPDSRK